MLGLSILFTAILAVQGAIINPSFENDGEGWDQYSQLFGTVTCCDANCGYNFAFDGRCWAWFGGVSDSEVGIVSQSIEIPIGAQSLNYYLAVVYMYSRDFFSDPGTYFRVSIDDSVVAYYNYLNATDPPMYQLYSVPISSFADGGYHTLSFYHYNVKQDL
eukprot:TRINITY_DN2236_c0_g1_i1.p2 TRINITY_DN2236_c0_g1~~TRINITY_DN2236_c0_g1_i1.p2  ORF type:complete len:160 (-),score=4.01 TRINITY_DN2236_c0_g1_i1:22-501(-)